MSRLLPVVLAGCIWKTEAEVIDRLDQDGDGIPGEVDCNDRDPEVDVLDGPFGDLVCGLTVTGDVYGGEELLEFVNCLHPFHGDDLVQLGWREDVWRFRSAAAAEVVITMDATEFWLNLGESDTDDIALVAFRGEQCEIPACVVGLPPAESPIPAGGGGGKDDRTRPWSPSVRFRAEAGEPWYVVVSGGCTLNTNDQRLEHELQPICDRVDSSPYALSVACEE